MGETQTPVVMSLACCCGCGDGSGLFAINARPSWQLRQFASELLTVHEWHVEWQPPQIFWICGFIMARCRRRSAEALSCILVGRMSARESNSCGGDDEEATTPPLPVSRSPSSSSSSDLLFLRSCFRFRAASSLDNK